MGVPAFFSWLSQKYPSIVVNAIEENRIINGVKIPVYPSRPNPNFQEFDNFYLDMNAIIHPCAHPEDRPAPKNEDEMFRLLFEYVDRLFAIVRPRKLLYMAVDGVAPRAKMNQQRSRRFRSSKEANEKQEEILSIRNDLESKGISLPPPKPKEEHFDPNCITPGTPFMARLAAALRYYVHLRINNNPAWQKIMVILSDAFVPGEGEHKIIDFIRRQRASPTYDPNIKHCITGPDADLIMLGLATHEVNLTILREDFSYLANQLVKCELCNQIGHTFKSCKGLMFNSKNPVVTVPRKSNYLFVRMDILRNYLNRDFRSLQLPYEFDLERAIDDWVFLCFFVGNDFLPHLPSLDIYEGAINRLIGIYREISFKTMGWLTDNGNVHLERVEMIMNELSKVEDDIFRTRRQNELYSCADQKQQSDKENKTRKSDLLPRPSSVVASHALGEKQEYFNGAQVRQQLADQRRVGMQTEQAKKILNELFTPIGGKKRRFADSDEDEPKTKSGHIEGESWREISRDAKSLNSSNILNSTTNTIETENGEDNEPEDLIRLWEDGWKDRYYKQKFGVSASDEDFRKKVAGAYTEGLCWMFKYYYSGCVSWDWYYPYHYAPFASDFDTIARFKPDWSKPTKPFNPLEQLMSVFPAASKSHIPEGWRNLMISPESPIYHFYPTEFKIDSNGEKFAGQGVVLLPFVDEKLLLTTLKELYNTLTDEEKSRNITSLEYLFTGKRHKLFSQLQEVYEKGKKNQNIAAKEWFKLEHDQKYGLSGEVSYDLNGHDIGTCYHTLFSCSDKYKDIPTNNCIMLTYRNLLSSNSN